MVGVCDFKRLGLRRQARRTSSSWPTSACRRMWRAAGCCFCDFKRLGLGVCDFLRLGSVFVTLSLWDSEILGAENLLLASTPGQKDVVKLADFGLSKDVESGVLSTSCGTPDYVAPEVLLNDHYDVGVDIWSIGVITYVLLCGFPPFYGERQKDLFENIMAGRYNFPEPEWSANSEEAKDFIRHMLVTDPKKRYTAQQCLDHKWIQMYNSTDSRRPVARGESFSVSKFRAYTEQYKKK
eukprot:TRINITY_DN4096_c0_g1_i1.p1 TRINITY_DN4096_c0_g1~~TRINITY_DN4096_c0_g1_i1.p1  ORF type:complete len:238 (+),score=53.50 TRINITY_DN4096_c0_g1_i1:104-817(+)